MNLTKEELTIIKLTLDSLKNIEIGEILGYSESTIKKKLSKIYKKLNISRRIELAVRYVKLKNYELGP